MIDEASRSNPPFGLRECASSAWAIVRDHWFPLALAEFFCEIIAILIAGSIFALFIDWKGWNFVIAIVSGCFAWSFLQSGYLKFCLEVCYTNKVSWGAFFSGMSYGLQMLISIICLWVAVGLGLVLFIIPGLFCAVRFCLSGFALVDQNLDAFKSLSVSNRMLKGFTGYAAAILGLTCLGVGMVGWLYGVLQPFKIISLAVLYRHIRARELVH